MDRIIRYIMSLIYTKPDKHIVVNLKGGLGNQLFQIALGHALCKRWNAILHIHTNTFYCGQGSHPSKYFESLYKQLVPYFDTCVYNTTYKEVQWSYYNINNDLCKLFESYNSILLDGYWQSECHFPNMKQELTQLLNLTHPYMHIPSSVFVTYPQLHDLSNACLIGVRRGDYCTGPNVRIHNPCGMTYYTKAMSYFAKDTRYFIMSDDISWCKSQFKDDGVTFLEIDDDLTSFYVGTLFPRYIISNSTFHWWMSYFSIYPHPAIIAPDKWLSMPNNNCIYRPEMVILERPIEP